MRRSMTCSMLGPPPLGGAVVVVVDVEVEVVLVEVVLVEVVLDVVVVEVDVDEGGGAVIRQKQDLLIEDIRLLGQHIDDFRLLCLLFLISLLFRALNLMIDAFNIRTGRFIIRQDRFSLFKFL